MPDNIESKSPLAQMEADIKNYESAYAVQEKYFKSVDSDGGDVITADEKENLKIIATLISKLKKEVKERKLILSNVDLQIVINKYSTLYKLVDASFYDKVNLNYKNWMSYIYTAGSVYSGAFDTFKSTVAAQDKYEADLISLAGSVLSVASIGTLSWLSTSGMLVVKLGTEYEKLINIAEDVAQAGADKAIGHIGATLTSPDIIDATTPFVFQNKISKKVLDTSLDILKKLSACKNVLVVCEQRLNELNESPKGKERGSDVAKKEYEIFIKVEAAIANAMGVANEWIGEKPPSINKKALSQDLERGFWANWLPRLKQHIPEKTEWRGNSRGTTPAHDIYDNWWWCTELTDRLTKLVDLKGIGVGEHGLDSWISVNDVKLLVDWANSFKPKYTF